jgi:CheY-like chemotaxis protein
MGLQFVDLNDQQLQQLHKLISELDAAAEQELEGRKKILLVGGTDTGRNINKSKLVLDGFYVLQATTTDEVFDILANEPPDAMIMEWQETAFNCKGLLAKIKEKPQYETIIRVVLSALTDVSVQRDIIAAGAHRCMAKMDTNPARLSQALKQLIAERDG